MSNPPIKKVAYWLFFLFFLYAIFTSPRIAGGLAADGWNFAETAFKNIFVFFDTVLRKT